MSVIFHYRDGTQASRNLQYGQHTYRPDGDPRSRSLWETSGVLVLGETLRGQERPILDQHLYRVDLPSPHPERILERLEIRAEIPGVEGLIAAASSLEHP